MSDEHWRAKSAVICGASAGLGREFAFELAHQQVGRLALVARSADQLESLRDQLLCKHPNLPIMSLTADLCEKEQLESVACRIKESFQQVDLLVQAVGKSDRGKLAELTRPHLQQLLEANLLSSLHALQCFEPIMTRPGGTIVLIGSLASKFAPRFLGGYAIAKHALAGLAQQARLELAEQGIHVLLSCPGPIARDDAGARYELGAGKEDLPPSVRLPGGGARLRGLDARRLARDILKAAHNKKREIIRPRKARLLCLLSTISPWLGDYVLRQKTS